MTTILLGGALGEKATIARRGVCISLGVELYELHQQNTKLVIRHRQDLHIPPNKSQQRMHRITRMSYCVDPVHAGREIKRGTYLVVHIVMAGIFITFNSRTMR